MNKEDVLESIKSINFGSAGCSLKIKIAAYNLLEYIKKNDNYDEIIEFIYKYYNEEYDYNASLTTPIDEVEYLLSTCCTFLLRGNKNSLDVAGLKSRKYTDKEIVNFFKFANLINEKFDYNLKLDSINNLQLQRNLLSQEKLQNTIEKTEERMSNIDERISKVHFDTISIISIFVAVIFALYGGTQLVSDIIEKVRPCNYKLLIKTAFLLGYILLTFISVVVAALYSYDKNKGRIILIAVLNGIYAIVVILSLIILK